MTDVMKAKRRLPALASRILIFGVSFALTIVLITTFRLAALRLAASKAAAPPAARPIPSGAPPQQIVIRVVQVAPKQARVPASYSQPRIVQRFHYVAAAPTFRRVAHTASHGS